MKPRRRKRLPQQTLIEIRLEATLSLHLGLKKLNCNQKVNRCFIFTCKTRFQSGFVNTGYLWLVVLAGTERSADSGAVGEHLDAWILIFFILRVKLPGFKNFVAERNFNIEEGLEEIGIKKSSRKSGEQMRNYKRWKKNYFHFLLILIWGICLRYFRFTKTRQRY